MLFDVHVKVLFERGLTQEELRLFSDNCVGSTFLGISPVVYSRYFKNGIVNNLIFRVNISHDMSKQIGDIQLSHHLASLPRITQTDIVKISRVTEYGKIKIVITKDGKND